MQVFINPTDKSFTLFRLFLLWSHFAFLLMASTMTFHCKRSIAKCAGMVALFQVNGLHMQAGMRSLLNTGVTKRTQVKRSFLIQAHDEIIYGFWR